MIQITIITLICCLLFGVPIAFAIGIAGTAGLYFGSTAPMFMVVKQFFEGINSFSYIEAFGSKLFSGMEDLMKKHGLPGHVSSLGARFAIYWGYEDRETDYDLRASQKLFRRDLANAFINGALDRGLYFHSYWNANIPSHCGFSVQHTLADADITLEKMDAVMADMKKLL